MHTLSSSSKATHSKLLFCARLPEPKGWVFAEVTSIGKSSCWSNEGFVDYDREGKLAYSTLPEPLRTGKNTNDAIYSSRTASGRSREWSFNSNSMMRSTRGGVVVKESRNLGYSRSVLIQQVT